MWLLWTWTCSSQKFPITLIRTLMAAAFFFVISPLWVACVWSRRLRPLLRWFLPTLKEFWGSYIRAPVLVCSPLKHTCTLPFFSFFQFYCRRSNGFLERGRPQKGPGPQIQKGVDVTLWRRNSELGRSECSVSRATPLRRRHLGSLRVSPLLRFHLFSASS